MAAAIATRLLEPLYQESRRGRRRRRRKKKKRCVIFKGSDCGSYKTQCHIWRTVNEPRSTTLSSVCSDTVEDAASQREQWAQLPAALGTMDRRVPAYLWRLQGRKADGHTSRPVPEQPPFLGPQCAAVWRRGCTACRTLPLFRSRDPRYVGNRIRLLRSVPAVRGRVDPAVRAARRRPLLCHSFSHLQRALRHHLQDPQPIFPASNEARRSPGESGRFEGERM